MNFSELISRLVQDTVGKNLWWSESSQGFREGSLLMFAPELILSATIVLLLLAR